MTALAPDIRPSEHPPIVPAPPARRTVRRRRHPWRTGMFHASSSLIALAWFAPIVIVVVTSFRTFDDIAANGIGSLPHSFTLQTYSDAWTQGGLFQALVNSMIVTIPTVFLTLLLSAAAAFGLSRYRIPFRRTILLIMLAGNLLPVQMILIPIARVSQQLNVYDTLAAVIAVQTAFGLGFYTFVLYGFMRSIPGELQDAASIDGAGTVRIFFQMILPLTRPALAALGALSFTWIFNDLLWSITLLQTTSKMPTTAAVLSLQGQYVSSWSVIAAATVIAAIPSTLVFLFFQRSFIGGLALGSVK
ncbi:carbohydrate ABC transporter permease [Diaminobutyricibacter tongyongensis]|uniref:Carbohydrate ABC transporter permease n=1 Tax=Leifsonia tongyongensis TaxID=1268043 RepID=A0A6L9XYG3_9MICO|nr:carbohydrate ABC transporter permease [Diaminobutyricibacter tongyongensis]NEN06247.1 carbohydrate ABC transporter permease [Diaminobutyricibacter tongyongensis]